MSRCLDPRAGQLTPAWALWFLIAFFQFDCNAQYRRVMTNVDNFSL